MSRASTGLVISAMGGSGPKVLFIHGFGADKQSWVGNAPAVFEFAQALVLDLPGHGDAALVNAKGDLRSLSDQVLDSMDSFCPQKYHLVGHSIGASIAMLCASARPELVESLTLIAPSGLGEGVNREFTEKFIRLAHRDEALALLQSLVFQPKLIASPLADFLLARLHSTGVRAALTDIAEGLHGADDLIQTTAAVIAEQGIKRQVVWGMQDRINPPDQSDESKFGGQWMWLDNCGHLPHIEHRSVVNNAICDFIKS